MKKTYLLIIALTAICCYGIYLTFPNYPHDVNPPSGRIDSLSQQQIVVDAYMDSCNTCSESKIKQYGELLEIECIKLKILEANGLQKSHLK